MRKIRRRRKIINAVKKLVAGGLAGIMVAVFILFWIISPSLEMPSIVRTIIYIIIVLATIMLISYALSEE